MMTDITTKYSQNTVRFPLNIFFSLLYFSYDQIKQIHPNKKKKKSVHMAWKIVTEGSDEDSMASSTSFDEQLYIFFFKHLQ